MPANQNSATPERSIDLIGDIHGHAEPLLALLRRLGYRVEKGEVSHPEGRKIVFLGDYIDRGPAIRETLQLVKMMVDSGDALALMGNHEFNAVCFHTLDGKGGFLRQHTDKNIGQHAATIAEFSGREEEWGR